MVDDLLFSDDLTLLPIELSVDVNDVLELHSNALEKLGQLKAERAGKLYVALKSHGEPHELAVELADEEEGRISKWQRKIGELALNILSEGLKDSLNQAKSLFDTSHPPKGKYPGDGWLGRLEAEFNDRFEIDFRGNACPIPLGKIEELVLARNAGIHEDLTDYKGKVTTPRFIGVDETGEEILSVAPKDLGQVGAEVNLFYSWVISRLKEIRDGSK